MIGATPQSEPEAAPADGHQLIAPERTPSSSRSLTPSASNAPQPPVGPELPAPNADFLDISRADESGAKDGGIDHKPSDLANPPNTPPSSSPVEVTDQFTSPSLGEDLTQHDTEIHPMKSSPVDLAELARLVRLQHNEEERYSQMKAELHQRCIRQALSYRLMRLGQSTRQALVETLKDKDKPNFTSLYYTFYELEGSCRNVRQPSLDQYSRGDQHDTTSPDPSKSTVSPFLGLPQPLCEAVLGFIHKVRTDPAFVADCICRLSLREMSALNFSQCLTDSSASVLLSTSRSERLSPKKTSAACLDHMMSFESRDPFSVLVFSPFSSPATQDSAEEALRTDMIGTSCAQLVNRSRPGADRFICNVLETWTSMRDWHGKSKLESYLLQVLHDGEILLKSPLEQFQEPLSRNKDFTTLETFFEKAVNDVFDVTHGPFSTETLPSGFREIACAILGKLSDSRRRQSSIQSFIICKWLYSRFVYNAIIYPEKHGILLDRFISEQSRSRILMEIAVRLQKQVLDSLHGWKYATFGNPQVRVAIDKIASWIKAPTIPSVRKLSSKYADPQTFLMLSSQDIITLIHTLLPDSDSFTDFSSGPLQRSDSSWSLSALSNQSHSTGSTSLSDASSVLTRGVSSITSLSTTRDQFPASNRDDFIDIGVNPMTADVSTDVWFSSEYRNDLKRACDALNPMPRHRTSERSLSHVDWAILWIDHEFQKLRLDISCVDDRNAYDFCDYPLAQQMASADERNFPDLSAAQSEMADSICELLRDYDIGEGQVLEAGSNETSNTLSRILHSLSLFVEQLKYHSDFDNALRLTLTTERLRSWVGSVGDSAVFETILCRIRDRSQRSLSQISSTIDRCDGLYTRLPSIQLGLDNSVAKLRSEFDLLRDKMWYMTDVRTSGCYDEVKAIANALRTAGQYKDSSTVKGMAQPKLRNPTKSWSSNTMLKSEAQILDIMTARANHGGYSKLADEQVDITRSWLQRLTLDTSLCRGEERIHRFHFEINRCINRLVGQTISESPVLWSSMLFKRERDDFSVSSANAVNNVLDRPSFHLANFSSENDVFTNPMRHSPGLFSISPASAQSSVSGPTPPWPFSTFGSTYSEASSPQRQDQKSKFMSRLRQALTGFFFDDLETYVFPNGSETDEWLGGDLVAASLERTQSPGQGFSSVPDSNGNFCTVATTDSELTARVADVHLSTGQPGELRLDLMPIFPFDEAMQHYLALFNVQSSPYSKLDSLVRFQHMAVAAFESYGSFDRPRCLDISTDQPPVIETIRKILDRPQFRPPALFRNLQYISVFVPPKILETTTRGEAFHNVALAALSLKQDICRSLIIKADETVAYHTQHRGLSITTSVDSTPHLSMEEAAKMWIITAKEGDPVAQRELATFYLTHPDLVPRVTHPLTKPSEVFKVERLSRRSEDPTRSDPYTMSVALHWMDLSAKGGDVLAQGFLKDREDLNSIP